MLAFCKHAYMGLLRCFSCTALELLSKLTKGNTHDVFQLVWFRGWGLIIRVNGQELPVEQHNFGSLHEPCTYIAMHGPSYILNARKPQPLGRMPGQKDLLHQESQIKLPKLSRSGRFSLAQWWRGQGVMLNGNCCERSVPFSILICGTF